MVVSIVLALALVAGQAAPTPGHLSGRVVADATNAPIAGARVTVFPARPSGPFGPPPQASTDENGNFAFSGLADGEYRVDVQKTGYAPSVEPFNRATTVHVPSAGLEVRLQRGGVITGRVLDASGQPLPDVQVMALRRLEQRNGEPGRWFPAPMTGGQQTNDVGEFRIAGLAAGEYLIAAMRAMTSPFGGPSVAASAHGTAMTNTYYPGTTNQAAAQPIAVRAGDTVANIEFTMQSSPAFRVSGRVVDESGQPVLGAMVMLMGDTRNVGFMGPSGHTQSDSDGRFSIADVTPGTYRLHASVPMRMEPGASAAGGIGAESVGVTAGVTGGVAFSSWSVDSRTGGVAGAGSAPTEIVVSDANVTGVRLTIKR
jgi:hypothetical protein